MIQVDLFGKVAILTAAARQPGQAIARALCKNGAAVALCDRDGSAAFLLAEALTREGYSCRGYALDVLDSASIPALCRTVREDMGRLDFCINNEKDDLIGGERQPVHLMDFDRYEQSVRREFLSAYYVSKYSMQQMIDGGAVVNITSSLGLAGAPDCMANVVSSGAVMSLSRTAALEMAPYNVRVYCIARGALADLPYEHAPTVEALAHQATKRPVTPEDVANAVLYCLSDEGAYANGDVLCLDGGQHIGFMRSF